MPEAKFKILNSTELFPIRNNPNPEAIGMKYDIDNCKLQNWFYHIC